MWGWGLELLHYEYIIRGRALGWVREAVEWEALTFFKRQIFLSLLLGEIRQR